MKSFKQFLKEMPVSIHTDPSDIESQQMDDHHTKKPGKYDRDEHVENEGNYSIHARSWKSENSDEHHPPHTYIAVHDDSDLHHMKTRGGTTKDGYFIANETKKHPESEIGAPDFYHSILRAGKHKGIQSGEEQTEGGKSIWKRLKHQYPEVHVTHHDKETGKEIPMHGEQDWDKNYDQPRETYFRAKLKS